MPRRPASAPTSGQRQETQPAPADERGPLIDHGVMSRQLFAWFVDIPFWGESKLKGAIRPSSLF